MTGRPTISVACDRGNTGIKLVVSSDAMTTQPFKIPSIVTKVASSDAGVSLGGNVWLCGDDALKNKTGTRLTPMDSQGAGKIENLAIVIAHAVRHVNKAGGDFYLNVALSSPFAGEGDALDKLVVKELRKLSGGFSIGGSEYLPHLSRVGTAHEGLVLMEVNEDIDGVVDMGFGTVIGGYRKSDGSVQPVGSERSGCREALEAMIKDGRFKAAITSAGFSNTPSLAKLSSLLSAGRWEVRGFDFSKHMKPHVGILTSNIEDTLRQVKGGLHHDNEWRESDPKIVLVGGAACILLKVMGEKATKWAEKHGIEIYDESPDFQTALILSQLQKTNPERFAVVEAA